MKQTVVKLSETHDLLMKSVQEHITVLVKQVIYRETVRKDTIETHPREFVI